MGTFTVVCCSISAVGLIWCLYMQTCRTDQWLKLCEAQEARNRRNGEKILKGAALAAKLFLKK